MLSNHLRVLPPALLATILAIAIVPATAGTAFAIGAITNHTIKLVDGPTKSAAKVGEVPAGVHVVVLWCGLNAKLCLVSFHGKGGFTSLDGLQLLTSDNGPFGGDGHDDHHVSLDPSGPTPNAPGSGGGGSDEPRSMAPADDQPGGNDTLNPHGPVIKLP